MNAALGGVSEGGTGTPLFEVTHSGGGPSALVANQSVGNAGGVTPSKFSLNVTRPEHGGHGLPPESCTAVGATATPGVVATVGCELAVDGGGAPGALTGAGADREAYAQWFADLVRTSGENVP